MERRRLGMVLLSIPLAGVLAIAAGCGSSASRTGEHVFQTAGCSTCHTLAAAGAQGQVGPNLDVLRPSEADVAQKVRYGGGGMPSFAASLSPDEIQAVASYIAKVAGQ